MSQLHVSIRYSNTAVVAPLVIHCFEVASLFGFYSITCFLLILFNCPILTLYTKISSMFLHASPMVAVPARACLCSPDRGEKPNCIHLCTSLWLSETQNIQVDPDTFNQECEKHLASKTVSHFLQYFGRSKRVSTIDAMIIWIERSIFKEKWFCDGKRLHNKHHMPYKWRCQAGGYESKEMTSSFRNPLGWSSSCVFEIWVWEVTLCWE